MAGRILANALSALLLLALLSSPAVAFSARVLVPSSRPSPKIRPHATAQQSQLSSKGHQRPLIGVVPPLRASIAPDDDLQGQPTSRIESLLSSYAGSRLLLAVVAIVYASNFPLGAIMADALPASAVTSSRFVVASAALLPFLPQIAPELRRPAVASGLFVSLGYIAQSLALVDSPPATVSFLGVATPIVICPLLECFVDGKKMSPRDAPQTWLAAMLCIAGVAMLELMGGGGIGSDATITSSPMPSSWGIDSGGMLSLLAGLGFGTGCYMSEKMMRGQPKEQALPITSVLVATTAAVSALWSLADGWMMEPDGWSYTLPGLFADPSLSTVAAAILWTGLISTSLNFFLEVKALGTIPSAEASVILAAEPLAAAALGSIMLHEQLAMCDYIGGALIITACLVNTLNPEDIMSRMGPLSAKEMEKAS